jgi:hypothetical protein
MSPSRKYSRQRQRTQEIQQAILQIFLEIKPRLTVRQIYYALTVRGVVPKTEGGYRQTVYQLKMMREVGIISYDWIADNTRWYLKPTTDASLEAALDRMQESYRKDVPLYVARGYGSMTVLYDAAEFLKAIDKPAFIYHFGDYDPSGVDAANKIRDGLLKHGANVTFERIAVTPAQIHTYDLPIRATKKKDPRSKQWGDQPSVELDALPAPVLRNLVKTCIERHIDQEEWAMAKTVEQLERHTLSTIRQNFVLDQNSLNGT